MLITRHRLTRLAGFTSVQFAVQVIGFASGIVLVRYMEPAQYGHYTLSISMVGLANVMFDLGLATAVLANGGALHADRGRLGALVGDAWVLQQRLAIVGALLLVPVFAAMFVWQGLAPAEVAVLALLVIGCTAFTVRNAIALSVVRLRGDLALQQWLEVGVNIGKLFMILAATLIFIDARLAVAINLAAAAATFWMLRRYLAVQLGACTRATREHAAALTGFVRRQAPNSLYYCISGQIAIWMVGLFGNADRVGEIGALGRLAVLFTIVGAVVTALVQPYFARAVTRRELVSGFGALNVFFSLLTAGLAVATLTIPGPFLWILGPRYAGLSAELVWMVLAASFSAWSGAVYSVGAARSWVVPATIVIPSGIATLALAAWLLDLSTVAGGFMMNAAVSAMALLVTVGFVTARLRATRQLAETTS